MTTTTKLTTTDAFYVIDLDTAPSATGVVRCAKKILLDGAVNLARSITYGYAVFGIQTSGASAGVNADGEHRDASIAAFVEELTELATSQRLLLDAGKGVGPDELAALAAGDQRFAGRIDLHDRLLAESATAAAATTRTLEGATVCIEDVGSPAAAVATRMTTEGATTRILPTVEALTEPCDVLCVGSKVGIVDHEVAAALAAKVIVPIGPLPVTARGLAVARRGGVEVLADFVTTAGPLLANWPRHEEPEQLLADVAARVAEVCAPLNDHADGALLAACFEAERFLTTWVDTLPFGRPLA